MRHAALVFFFFLFHKGHYYINVNLKENILLFFHINAVDPEENNSSLKERGKSSENWIENAEVLLIVPVFLIATFKHAVAPISNRAKQNLNCISWH